MSKLKQAALIIAVTLGLFSAQNASAREACSCLVKEINKLTNRQWDISIKCLGRDMKQNTQPAKECAKACLTLEKEDIDKSYRSVLKTYTAREQCSEGLRKLYDHIYGVHVDVEPKL